MSDRRLGRQAFLKLFRKGAIVTGAVFGLEVTGIDIDVRVPTPLRLWRGLAQFVTPRSQLRSLHSQLFGVQGLVDTRAGAAHAAYPHQVHPDDQMAASALRSLYRPTQAIEWEDKPWEGPPTTTPSYSVTPSPTRFHALCCPIERPKEFSNSTEIPCISQGGHRSCILTTTKHPRLNVTWPVSSEKGLVTNSTTTRRGNTIVPTIEIRETGSTSTTSS